MISILTHHVDIQFTSIICSLKLGPPNVALVLFFSKSFFYSNNMSYLAQVFAIQYTNMHHVADIKTL
jgi:hypothetical protein